MHRIRAALERGVPLYNSGRHGDCAATYARALKELAEDGSLLRVRAWIGQELVDATSLKDDDKRAWRLRRTLDELAQHVHASPPVSGTADPAAAAGSAAAGFAFGGRGGGGERAVRRFRTVNDTVMGGRSSSSLRMSGEGTHAVFSGAISTDGGGFAGCSAATAGGGFGGARGVCATVRGDGQLYKVVLAEEGSGGRGGGVQYQCDFVAPRGEWRSLKLPFASFRPSWRGRQVPDAKPLRPAAIAELGLRLSLLTDSGQPNRTLKEGAFRLDVQEVVPYSE